MFVVLPDGSVSSIHAAGYGARPRTRLRTASAVVLKLMRQVSLKIFGAALSSPSGCGIEEILPDSICSTVLSTRSAPSIMRRSWTMPALSSGAMVIFSCMMMLPVSISCWRKKVVMPVSVSPLMTAQLIGAAPRY